MKVRSHLVSLTLAALLPLAVLAAILALFLVHEQRQTFLRGTEDRVRAFTTALDSEIKGSIDTLRALAHVRSLDEGNLTLFRKTAWQILATQERWLTINLALPDGQQVMNLLQPAGAPLPRIPETEEALILPMHTLQPVVSDLTMGPVTKRLDFAVRVPVVRDGRVVSVLSAVVDPESIARLLKAQELPPGWEGIVVDRQGRFVARTLEPEKSLGQLASTELREAIARSPSGWYRGKNLEGVPSYHVYRRSPATGWSSAVAVPASIVDATATRALLLFALALAAATALALTLAALVGRRIAQPITALAAATERMARGEEPRVSGSTHIDELHVLEKALRNAAQTQAALKRAEEQTRSVVDHVFDGIITIDDRGAIESFNSAAEKLFGYGASEVIGKNVKVLMPEPYQGAHDSFIQHYLQTGEARVIGIGREVTGQRKDGSTFPMDLAVSEFRLGERRFFTGIVRDITERKRAEDALLEADRQKDVFLAMLGHELRNPLSAVTTAAHVLRTVLPGDGPGGAVQAIIERQTGHMVRLIDDLLDISRVRLGKLTVKREILDLGGLVAQVTQSWQSSGAFEGRAMVTQSLAPVWINADRGRVEQILSNLLHNALKFTPADGAVSVIVRQDAQGAMLRVKDNGRGIARESLGRIFEPFWQGEQNAHTAHGGLGLGLALVKRLAEMQDGSISCESDGVGHGTVFTVRFPAVAAPSDRGERREPIRPGNPPSITHVTNA